MEMAQVQMQTERERQELAYERARKLESRWAKVETGIIIGCFIWMFALDQSLASGIWMLGICVAAVVVHAILLMRRDRAYWAFHRIVEVSA